LALSSEPFGTDCSQLGVSLDALEPALEALSGRHPPCGWVGSLRTPMPACALERYQHESLRRWRLIFALAAMQTKIETVPRACRTRHNLRGVRDVLVENQ
jgi:hypothetical protein